MNGGERGSLELQLTKVVTSNFVVLAPCVIHHLWTRVVTQAGGV